MTTTGNGPLAGIRIVELAGIGPGPFCAMLLADLGAEVIRVDRRNQDALMPGAPETDLLNRNRASIVLDLKQPRGLDIARRLIDRADALIEGFRPGVTERLGLGPAECLARNERLVYGRMTGFGQDGPLSQAAGHDINYIALSGALDAIGRPGERSVPPLNLVGDFGGGALYLAMGILAGLVECARSGRGQVVDAAMVEGASSLMTLFHGLRASGHWRDPRGSNMLDGGAPFYDVYATSDGKQVAVGALEPKFFAEMAERIGLDGRFVERQQDRSVWPEMRAELKRIFWGKPRDVWAAELEGTDACVTGVYSLEEAPAHPHNIARGTFAAVAGVTQPMPAPRFDRTPAATPRAATRPGAGSDAVLAGLGLGQAEIGMLRAERIVS